MRRPTKKIKSHLHSRKKTSIDAIIPTFNEEKSIIKCLRSIEKMTLPSNILLKIKIYDAYSTDNTRNLILNFIKNKKGFELCNNDGKYPAQAMNKAIQTSSADFIARFDAHSIYPEKYLCDCLSLIISKKADIVGGVIKTLPANNTIGALIVQSITSHRFGIGNSPFRAGAKPHFAETVPFGFFKRDVFERVGLFNEKLIRCQDFEFNQRVVHNGGKIYLDPKIVICYFNQSKFINFIKKQLLLEGPYNPLMWYLAPYTFKIRHAITGVFSLGILMGVCTYFLNSFLFNVFIAVCATYIMLAILSSIQCYNKHKSFLALVLLPFAFFIFHFSHGVGVLKGCLMLLKKEGRK